MSTDPDLTARLLAEALPYIQRFHDRVVVVKYGGNAMTAEGDAGFARGRRADALRRPAPGRRARRRPPDHRTDGPPGQGGQFRNGLRVTDAESLEIARMVLVGKVNRELVAAPSTATAPWRWASPARTPGSSAPACATPSSASWAT